MGVGDAQSVVGHGHVLVRSAAVPVLHFPFVQHAAAAVDNQFVQGKVCGEFRAAGPGKAELFAGKILNPFRQFFRADVAALPVMGAALGNQNTVAVLQLFQSCHAQHGLFQIAFVTGH